MILAAVPILIELFTSEGCSSCPPADAVLARLYEKQPLPGVQLVVLSEHVDYWDDLGWKDPFSRHLFTERQSGYGSRLYTPQAVVDGRADVLGSDEEGILSAAKRAAASAHGQVRLVRGPEQKKLNFFLTGLPDHGPAQVWLAVVEDGLVDHVLGGENGGRTLRHTAVARALERVGTVPAGARSWEGSAEIPTDSAWKNTRLAVFVQDRESRRVLAAGSM